MMQRKDDVPLPENHSPGALKLVKEFPLQAPFVAADRTRTIVIVSFVGYSGYSFVYRDPSWVGYDSRSKGEFEKEFKVVANYTAVKAAGLFLETAEKVGATPPVISLLKAIVDGKVQVGYADIDGAQSTQESMTMAAKKKAAGKKVAGKKAAAPKVEKKVAATAAETSTKKSKKAAAPAAEKKGESKGSKFRQSVIKVLVDKNPRREGTNAYGHFARIKDGMTVQDYVDAGGDLGYLSYDIRHEHVALEQPSA